MLYNIRNNINGNKPWYLSVDTAVRLCSI